MTATSPLPIRLMVNRDRTQPLTRRPVRVRWPAPDSRAELAQVPLRECHAGPGFQIAFESNRACFVRELDDNVDGLRAVLRCVYAAGRVVFCVTPRYVGCQAGVVTGRDCAAFENVDEPLRHGAGQARSGPCGNGRNRIAARRNHAMFSTTADTWDRKMCCWW